MVRSKKRDILDLIDNFYEYLSQHDEVFLSSFRNLEDPEKRIYYPTNKRIFEIIKAIQDRPYIYIKNPNEKTTLLKLSTQERNPKIRYIQINDVIKKAQDRYEHLSKMVQSASSKEFGIWIEQYQDLVINIINQMKRLRDRDKDYI